MAADREEQALLESWPDNLGDTAAKQQVFTLWVCHL